MLLETRRFSCWVTPRLLGPDLLKASVLGLSKGCEEYSQLPNRYILERNEHPVQVSCARDYCYRTRYIKLHIDHFICEDLCHAIIDLNVDEELFKRLQDFL